MFNLDAITNENNIKHNLKWPYIPDHPYRMLMDLLYQKKQMHNLI